MKHEGFGLVVVVVLAMLGSGVEAGDLRSDAEALIEFASKVSHSRRVNWNGSTSACTSWVGVTCNGEGSRVTGVRLPGVGLLGRIPTGTLGKLDQLRVLSLRSNDLWGELPSDVASIPTLQFLFLQHNNFTGTLPDSLSPRLLALDLSSNSFTGPIPPPLLSLPALVLLNLQFNFLFGPIPDDHVPPHTTTPRRLKLLNLTHNNLTGSIPTSLVNFSASSFLANSLCGPPLPTSCSSTTTSAVHPSTNKLLSFPALLAILAVSCLVLIAAAVAFIWCTKSRKSGDQDKGGEDKSKGKPADSINKKMMDMSSEAFGSGIQDGDKNKLVFFQGCAYNFDLEDLLRASAEVLGKGTYGTAYKAILDEGTTVVVKRLKEVGTPRRDFEHNMEIISKVAQHPNLAPLRAYYYSKDEKLMVYDYASSGSLAMLLHGYRGNAGRKPLNWSARMKILGDIAKGILHIHCSEEKLIHGNIKSSNVLLTRDLEGLVSDFGLSLLMEWQAQPGRSRSVGYQAPEVIEMSKAGSQKSDVYSFGVLLLEVLTGKAPLKSSHSAEVEVVLDLPRWVQSVVREEWTSEVFDTELLRTPNAEEEMVHMLQIALACVARLPDTRPTMDQVLNMMHAASAAAAADSSDERTSKESNAATYTP